MRTSPAAAARRGWSWLNPNLLSVLLMAVVLSACEAGTVTLVEPEEAAEGETTLEVHVKLEDSALAEELGWEAGVPGAVAEWAYVQRRRYLFRDAESDSAGMIRIAPEGGGYHWIAAEREVEIEGVPRVLGGGAKSYESTDLSLRLDDPGTLVISEVYMDGPPPWETAGLGYHGSKYIELYNNSNALIYLDRKVLGRAYSFPWVDLSRHGHHPCSYTKPFREDPDAVWSASHWRFPGKGTEHPIAPGEAVMVAVSAADHTGVHASMLDLSHARFELAGEGAADNPAAANLANLSTPGPRADFLISQAFWFVSDPVDVDALPMMSDEVSPGTDVGYRGFPANAILDVAVMWWDATSSTITDRDNPPCEHPIHPSFDALPGGYLYGSARPEDLLVSPQRRVIRMNGGQPVLLDTNTSAVDFENVERTPGWIP